MTLSKPLIAAEFPALASAHGARFSGYVHVGSGLTRADARAIEQAVIDRAGGPGGTNTFANGLAPAPGGLSNARNEIAASRSSYDSAANWR